MKNFIQNGSTINYRVTGKKVKSGEFVAVASLIAVAVTDGKVGDTIAMHTTGVYSLPKADGIEIKQGEKVYIDSTGETKQLTNVGVIPGTDPDNDPSIENVFAGRAWEYADSSDETVNVNINF